MNVKARHSSFLRPERFVSGTRRREGEEPYAKDIRIMFNNFA